MSDDTPREGFNRRETLAFGTVAAGVALATAGGAEAAVAKRTAGSAPMRSNRIVDAKGGVEVSAGGEVHQVRTGDGAAMTTQQGLSIADDENSLKAGSRGPVLLEAARAAICAADRKSVV